MENPVHYLLDGQYKSITYQQQTYKDSFQRWMLRKSRVTKTLGFASDRFYLIHRVGAKKGLIIEIFIANSTIFFQIIGFYIPADYLLGLQGIVVTITYLI